MRRRVLTDCKRVILFTDVELMDHSSSDKYFHSYYEPEFNLPEWRSFVRDEKVKHRQDILVIAVGARFLQERKRKISAKNQMSKLIRDVVDHMPWINRIVVTSVLPRADQEVKYQELIRGVNLAFGNAVHFVKSSGPTIKKMLRFVPTHKIFLEEYEYFDFHTGGMSVQQRIVRPISTYFNPDTGSLNAQGLEHLRSYILTKLGLLIPGNPWRRPPVVRQRKEVKKALRDAWLLSHGGSPAPDISLSDQGQGFRRRNGCSR